MQPRTAHDVFHSVPLGALVAFSDGTPQPPARHTKKLAQWQQANGQGVLVRKSHPPRYAHGFALPPSFTLRVSTSPIVVIQHNFSLRAEKQTEFTVLAVPAPGSVLLVHHDDLVGTFDTAENATAYALGRSRGLRDIKEQGYHIEPAGYGGGAPGRLRRGAQLLHAFEQVNVWKEYESSADLVLERITTSDFLRLPSTAGAALHARMEAEPFRREAIALEIFDESAVACAT